MLRSNCIRMGMLVFGVAIAGSCGEPDRPPAIGQTEGTPKFMIRDRSTEPLLRADKPWEDCSLGLATVIREDRRWRMWYMSSDHNYKRDDDLFYCYAESQDGLKWTKPDLGLVEYQGNKHNNILISGSLAGGLSPSYVFLDEGKGAGQKYKLIFHRFNSAEQAWWVYGGISADGIHWTPLPNPLSRKNSDTQTTCIPDGGKYRLYTRIWRGGWRGVRTVGYTESDHFGDFPEPVEIFSHDNQDPEGMQFYSSAATKLAEHFYVMFPAAFYTKNQTVRSHLAWSRDGVHFTRYGRVPVADVGRDFDSQGVYVCSGAVPGDTPNTWWFYYFGTRMEHDSSSPANTHFDGGIGRFLLVATNSTSAARAPEDYLTDRQDLFSLTSQGWGVLGIDAAAHPPGANPMTLRIKDKEYRKGMGSHAPSEMVIELDGMYESFEAEVGVQWQGGRQGSVVLKVIADGKELFNSGVMRETTPAQRARVSVKGVQELKLIATDAGDGIACDLADWAEARLTPDPAAVALAGQNAVDIAPFGRVLAWDPARMDGARNGRTEEFCAEDLFLETDLLPGADGLYTVPRAKYGIGCIGLQWLEKRRLTRLELRFADASGTPAPEGAQVQCWIAGEQGGSRWQGHWTPMKGALRQAGDRWTFDIDWQGNPLRRVGIMKIRWLLPALAEPVPVRGLAAYTDSRWDVAEVKLQLEKPKPGIMGRVELYNGAATGAGEWDMAKPSLLKVRYSRPRSFKGDRTVLRVKLPDGAFGVAMDDLLENNCVYVRDFGLFATLEPARVTLAEYQDTIAPRKTVLQRVRSMPDQTFEQALKKLHRPEADLGPTMLSLACDNHKFILARSGLIEFDTRPEAINCFDRPFGQRYCSQFVPEFGSGKDLKTRRHLEEGWMPIPVITMDDQGVVYRQRTFVAPYDKAPLASDAPAWLNRKPLCVAEITIENPQPKPANVSVKLRFVADVEKSEPAAVEPAARGAIFLKSGKPLALVDAGSTAMLQSEVKDGAWAIRGELAAHSKARLKVCIPAWAVSAQEIGEIAADADLTADTKAYWQKLISAGMRVEIPDPLLMNLVYASEVHCLLAARNEDGVNVAPWISSSSYGPLESEAHSIVRGMQVMGQTDFARRSLDFFIKRYNRAGYLTTGYTVMGTGWHLWTLGEYYALTRDSNWLRQVAPEVERVCKWSMAQRDKTKKLDARGEPLPEYGLMPPGVMADWPVYAYYACLNGYYAAGLRTTGKALADINYPGNQAITSAGAELGAAIMRGFHWAQSLAPVFPLQDGTWVPEYPTQIFCPAPVEQLYGGEDYGRSWCYDVEIGAHHLIPFGVMNPQSRDAAWLMDHMEDAQFLKGGWHYYEADQCRKDWFNFGGFAKVQPYYARTVEAHALRDDLKPFIRAYFNTIPTLLNREDLSLWEHFFNGAYNKTHETGYLLHQTRTLLLNERGDELWIAPFVTSNWMKDGMSVAVSDAPSHFGKVRYRITSHVADDYIQAVVAPPSRQEPKAIVIRLRHPEGKPIKSVTVNGTPHADFDPAAETVRIKPSRAGIVVKAAF